LKFTFKHDNGHIIKCSYSKCDIKKCQKSVISESGKQGMWFPYLFF